MTHDELLDDRRRSVRRLAPPAATDGRRPPASDVEPRRAAAPRLAVVPREGAAQSELRIGHLSARRDTPDYPALLVMNAVLGGQFVSRVNLKLREEKGYTYGARTGFDWRRGLAPFALQASVHTAATADAIRDSLAELDAIRGARPPTRGGAVAGQGVADARATRGTSRPRSRWRGRWRSSRSTICPIPTSRSSSRRSTRSPAPTS